MGSVTAKSPDGSPLQLRLLGGFSLSGQDGGAIDVSSRKNRALLAVLALSRNMRLPRLTVADLLWGSHGEDQARSSLRQSLTVLRRELGSHAAILTAADDAIGLAAGGLTTDAAQLLAAADGAGLPDLDAAEAWTGELLPGHALAEEAFESWLASERRRLSAAAIRLFDRLASTLTGVQRIAAAQILVRLDPLRESSHRLLMAAQAGAGDRGLALRQYEELKAILHKELGTEPAAETQALWREIAARAAAPGPGAPPLQHAASAKPAIAVLPFDNASADPGQAFLSDGIAEDIIASLSRFRQLTVIARKSSFGYRNSDLSSSEIGARLRVPYALHGSVRRAGERIRVNAELVDTVSGAALWSERFDRGVDDVFAVIDALSAAIVTATVGRIEDERLRQSRRKPLERYDAYELVLRGRHIMHGGSLDELRAARRQFEAAVALEPENALALTQLAFSHLQEFFFDDTGGALSQAEEIAGRAIAADEEDAWSHMILGLAHLHHRRFDLALRYCGRAAALNPNDPKLVSKYGLVLVDAGRPDEAIPFIERAMQLSPLHPEDFNDYLALAHYAAHRYDKAREAMQALPDTSFYFHVWMAAISYRLGDQAAAQRHARKTKELAPDFSVERFAAMEPIKSAADLAHWTDALRGAGFA